MSKENIELREINDKLTPGKKAIDELYKKAFKTQAGEKYINAPEEIFLARGIIPESDPAKDTIPAARVKDNKAAIIAVAAVLALAVGTVAFLSVITRRGLEQDSSVTTTQKAEDNKTESYKSIFELTPQEEKDAVPPYEWISRKLDEAYEEYKANGKYFNRLPYMQSFKELAGYSESLSVYVVDMYQNGELEDFEKFYIADEAVSYGIFHYYTTAMLLQDNALDYFSKLWAYDDDETIYDDEYKYSEMINHLAGVPDYKNDADYKTLLAKVNENPEHISNCFTRIYRAGLIDEKGLEIAYEICSDMDKDPDYFERLTSPEDAKNYLEENYENMYLDDNYGYFADTKFIDDYVKVKLQRLGEYYTDSGKAFDEKYELNYKCLKKEGIFTLLGSIYGMYERGELTDNEKAAALYIVADLLHYDLNENVKSAEYVEQMLDKLKETAQALMYDADYFQGRCGGNYRNYRESALRSGNVDFYNRLFENIIVLKNTQEPSRSDGRSYADKANAYAYVDIVAIGRKTLHIVIPSEDGREIIIDDAVYKNVDKELFGMIVEIIKDRIPPYGSKTYDPEYKNITITENGKTTYITGRDQAIALRAYALYAYQNTYGKEVDTDKVKGTHITVSGVGEHNKAICEIIIPDDEDCIYVGGVKLFVSKSEISELLEGIRSSGDGKLATDYGYSEKAGK